MNRTERFYRIDQMLAERRIVPLATFLDELAVSRATFKRDLEYLRDRLHAPIVWDREAGGYRFERAPAEGPRYELPGLWFSASEAHALLAAHRLLDEIEPGILAGRLKPLVSRLEALLESGGHAADEVRRRVRILAMHRRKIEPAGFAEIAHALLTRRRIEIEAWHRGRDEVSARVVSPQRLVHYRDNWYLDAWCHWRRALRSFSVDAIRRVRLLDEKAREIADKTLDRHFSSAYGIFAGAPKARAVLRFSPERARWVSHERWHRDQVGEWLPDGSYRLAVPYADEREILMDILRHGAAATVEAPARLRERVAAEVDGIAAHYRRQVGPGGTARRNAGSPIEPPARQNEREFHRARGRHAP